MILRRRQQRERKQEEEVLLSPSKRRNRQNAFLATAEGGEHQLQRTPTGQIAKRNQLHASGLLNSVQKANNQSFSLLCLPRELRDHIYSYLVVRRRISSSTLIDATTILKDQKKRVTAQANRDKQNRKRRLSGKPPIRTRSSPSQPILELSLLQVSMRVREEASEALYSSNTFAITLSHLPVTTFEVPSWELPRIKRLQIELQLKDATRMNKHIDWTTFFTAFRSLQRLRIVFSYHPRYYDWAQAEMQSWATTHYVHKAMFGELLSAVPGHVVLRFGPPLDEVDRSYLQAKCVDKKLLKDMYSELSGRWRRSDPIQKLEHVFD